MAPPPPRPFDAVVFDFGGVIITPITNKISALAERSKVDLDELLEVLMGPKHGSTPDHPWHMAERGELAVDDLQAGVAPYATERGFELSGDEMEMLFDQEYTYSQAVIDRIASLRVEGYRTGLLTNSVKEFRPTLERQVDLRIFDVVVDSSEEGCRKPEREIFDRMAERLGVTAERIIFLDDFEPNVVGARAAGWSAIHCVDPLDALAELDRALAGG